VDLRHALPRLQTVENSEERDRDVIQETYCKVAGSASYKQITTHAGFILTDTLLVNT